eukprot:TRINITY_DN23657_c0_g1_i1.p2 TRINITY_DN23657_c0_g1~~TRINITY_DN23657_c0_g1_i1.p2  ORF type:complete len:305 (+),score=54.95 TRINITY_DN23657_c0_g1_i1:76-990(+)
MRCLRAARGGAPGRLRRRCASDIALVAIDMDGTLLAGHGVVPPRCVAAVARAEQRGVRCVAATGRGRAASLRALERSGDAMSALRSLRGGVFLSGSWTLCPDSGTVLRDHALGAGALDVAVAAARDVDGCTVVVVSGDKLFCGERTHWTQWLEEKGDTPPIQPVGWDNLAGVAAHVAVLLIEPERTAKVAAALRARDLGSFGAHFLQPMPHIIDVVPDPTDAEGPRGKAAGLAAMCAELGIAPEQVLAIGDSENDLDMFAFAGHSCAMANGSDRIRAAANCVVARNDDPDCPGVAEAIERFVLA